MSRFTSAGGRLKESWNGKNMADLATAVGEKGRYLTLYGPASNAGHGQVTGLFPYFTTDATGDHVVDMKPSMTFVDLAIGAALPIAVELCAGVGDVLAVTTPDLQTQFQQIRDTLSAALAEMMMQPSAGSPP